MYPPSSSSFVIPGRDEGKKERRKEGRKARHSDMNDDESGTLVTWAGHNEGCGFTSDIAGSRPIPCNI